MLVKSKVQAAVERADGVQAEQNALAMQCYVSIQTFVAFRNRPKRVSASTSSTTTTTNFAKK